MDLLLIDSLFTLIFQLATVAAVFASTCFRYFAYETFDKYRRDIVTMNVNIIIN